MTRIPGSRRWLVTPLLAAMLLAGCASEQALRDGQTLIDAGRYEEGLERLNEAAVKSPGEPRYRATVVLQQERIVASLLATADQLRLNGEYEAAFDAYQRVLRLSPRNSRALEALRAIEQRRNVDEMQKQARAAFRRGDIELADKQLSAVLALDPTLTDALTLRKEIELQHARTASTYPRLRSNFTRPVTLEFRDANLKMILDALSRTTGINFIVDKDVKPDLKATIFVKQVPVEDALDLVLSQSGLEKKVVNDNTVLVYPNTPAKLREFQDWVIRTFFVTNMDVKQAQTLIKTMVKTKDLFIDEKLNTLTMRDTPDAIRIAEKLLEVNDQAEGEVVLEVELLDVARDRGLDLGITWPSTFSVLAPPLDATTVAGPATLLSQLRAPIGSSRIGINRTISATASQINTDVNTLASPRIRVRNKEKAKIHIGDRIPIVNATSVPSTQGPVTTETVQYLDTGIKLEVEPTIYQSDEVAIKISMEVSDSVDQGTTNAGTTLVRVKTTNAQTSLRLKNGETQILAGLIRNDHTNNVDGIPGITDVPGVGRLFGSHKDDFSKRELVLSITPRIVRNTPYLAPHLLEYGSGTEGSMRSRPLTMQTTAADTATPVTLTAPPGTPGGAPAGAGVLPATPARPGRVATPRTPPSPQVSTPNAPATPGGNAAVPQAADATVVAAAGATPAVPGAAGGPATLAFDGNNQMKVGQETTVSLNLNFDQPLVSTSFQLGFDPKLVKVEEVTEGNALRADAVQTTYSSRIDAEAGRIIINVARPTDNGTTGSGTLVQVKLSGIAPAESTSLRVLGFSAVAPGNRIQPVTLPQVFNLVVEP